MSTHRVFVPGLMALAFLHGCQTAPPAPAAPVDGPSAAAFAAALPASKRPRSAQVLRAADVPAFIDALPGGRASLLFLDIRSTGEARDVGVLTGADDLVPFIELPARSAGATPARRPPPRADFIPDVERRLIAKGLGHDDAVLLICRSGDRSARAADQLTDAGFTRVISVVDGFEGNLSPSGRRDVDGWKNAGLPWSRLTRPDR